MTRVKIIFIVLLVAVGVFHYAPIQITVETPEANVTIGSIGSSDTSALSDVDRMDQTETDGTTPTVRPVQADDPTDTSTPTPESSDELNRERIEQLVHENVNEERLSRGLSRIEHDQELVEIARYHSRDMAESGYFSHTSPAGMDFEDRYGRFGYDCQVPMGGTSYAIGGENILYTYYETRINTEGGTAYYSSEEELAAGIVSQWMNSPGHRRVCPRDWRPAGDRARHFLRDQRADAGVRRLL